MHSALLPGLQPAELMREGGGEEGWLIAARMMNGPTNADKISAAICDVRNTHAAPHTHTHIHTCCCSGGLRIAQDAGSI